MPDEQALSDEQLLIRYPILRYFETEHLPLHLGLVSRPFQSLAWATAKNMPYCAETSAGLRKLLEAKDCVVRAALEGK